MFKEYDYVRTTVEADGIKKGQKGTIIHIFTEPNLAYEVEFTDQEGRTLAQKAFLPEEIAPAH